MTSSLLLSSGEFAQMCSVSRELLIHYDKIGLLKPQEVKGNGYRYYSLKQLYTFDAIRFFVDTGMSMKEIKDYLDNRTTERFLDTAQRSIEQMERQQEVLKARIGMMEKMRYIVQRALTFPKDTPRISFWDENWLLTTDVRRERTQDAYAQAITEHSEFCKSTAGVSKFPLGRIVDIPDTKNPDEFYYTKLITWINKPETRAHLSGRLECKPKGNYAVILHQGGTSSAGRSYDKLFKYLRREGLKAQGPLYELDMHSYLMSDSSEDYLLHISIPVDV